MCGCGPASLFLVIAGSARAWDVRQYQSRKQTMTEEEVTKWELRYQFGAMFYASALGLWCFVALLGSTMRSRT